MRWHWRQSSRSVGSATVGLSMTTWILVLLAESAAELQGEGFSAAVSLP